MTQKRIHFYSETKPPASFTGAEQLIIEIGCSQAVFLVRTAGSGLTEALEIFQYDSADTAWDEVFTEIKKTSELLTHTYQDARIFYNFPEALIVPESKFGVAAGKDYLEQIYGERFSDPVSYEKLLAGIGMNVVYRVTKPVADWVAQQFPGRHHSAHIYTEILESLYSRSLPEGNFTVIRFYRKHLIVAVLKNKKLQIIQSFNYDVDEDILYYLLSIIQQFELNPDYSVAEISGELDKQSVIAQQLPNLFANITWVDSEATGVFAAVVAAYPPHYFTPYAKLGL